MKCPPTPTPILRAIQALALCVGLHPLCQAQPEFESFKMTGAEGFVGVVGQTSGVTTTLTDPSNGSGTATRQKQTDMRLETSLTTHSYIYHPKLLSLDVGLGLVSAYGRSDSDGIQGSSHEPLYNLSAHAVLLADKPARGTLFYDRLNSTPSVDPGEVFNQQNTRYGLTAALLAPLTPVAMDFTATREHNQGSSSTRVVEDKIDRLGLKVSRELWSYGRTQFSYQTLQQDSSSGSTSLALQNSHQEQKSISLDTRLRLGKQTPFELNNRIDYSRQKYTQQSGTTPELDDLRFALDASGALGKQWLVFANYQFGRNRQDDKATLTDTANLSTSWAAAKGLDLNAGAHFNNAKAEQFASHARGFDGSVSLSQELPIGTLQAGYSARYEQRDQSASGTQVAIVGERVTLNSTTAVTLARTRVTGASVQVRNVTRTQTYVEGVDYVLSVVGISTRIQRLLSGIILDGEEVLIDYVFDVGGTFANTQLDQGLNLNWAVTRMLSVYVRYNDSTPKLTSGSPTSPLNAVQSRLVGARADVPLSSQIELSAGGLLELEDHRETISPFVRKAGEAYLQGEIPLQTRNNYRLGTRRSIVTADNLLQGSDLISYDLLLGLRFDSGLSLNAIGLYERDNGGVELRVRKSASLKAQWRYRRLSLSADLSRVQEEQGLYVRDRTMGRVDLRRDF